MVCIRTTAYRCGGVSRRGSNSSNSSGSHPSSLLLSSPHTSIATVHVTLRSFAPLSSSHNSSTLYSFSHSPLLHPSFSLAPSSLSATSSSSTPLCCSRRFLSFSSSRSFPSSTTEQERNRTKEGSGGAKSDGEEATSATNSSTPVVKKVAVEAAVEETVKRFPKRLAPTWGTSRCHAAIDDATTYDSTQGTSRVVGTATPTGGGNGSEKEKPTLVVGGTKSSLPPLQQPLHTTADADVDTSARVPTQKEGPSVPLALASSLPPLPPPLPITPLLEEKEGLKKAMPSEEKEKETRTPTQDLSEAKNVDEKGTSGKGSTAEENEKGQATEDNLLCAAKSSIGKLIDKADLPHRLQIVEELRASLAAEEERTKSGPASPLLKNLRAVDENEKQQSEQLVKGQLEGGKASDQKNDSSTATANEKADNGSIKTKEKEKESKERAAIVEKQQQEQLDEVFNEAIGCESRQLKREIIADIIGEERALIDSERAAHLHVDSSSSSNSVSGGVINKGTNAAHSNGDIDSGNAANVNEEGAVAAVVGQADPSNSSSSNTKLTTASGTKSESTCRAAGKENNLLPQFSNVSAETAATSAPPASSSPASSKYVRNQQQTSSAAEAAVGQTATDSANANTAATGSSTQKPPTPSVSSTDEDSEHARTHKEQEQQQEQQHQRVKTILRLALGGGNEAAGQALLTKLLTQKLEKEVERGGRNTANENVSSASSSSSSWTSASFEFGLARGNRGPLTPISVINPTAWGPNNKKGFCKEHTTRQKVELLRALRYSYPTTNNATCAPSLLSAQKAGDPLVSSGSSVGGGGSREVIADETKEEFADDNDNENGCDDVTSSSPFFGDYDTPLPPAPPELIASLHVLPEDDLLISVVPRTGKPRVAPRPVRVPSKLIARHVYGSNPNNVNSSRNQGHYFPPPSLAHQSPFQSQHGRVGGASGSSGGGVAARRWGASAATAAAFAASVAASQQRIPNPISSSSSSSATSPSATTPASTPNPYNNHNYFDWVDVQSHPTATLHEYLTSLASLLVDLDIHESLVSTALDNVVLPQFSVAEGGCYSLVLRSVSEELLSAGDIIIASASSSGSSSQVGDSVGGSSSPAGANRVESPTTTANEDRQEAAFVSSVSAASTTVVRMSSIVGRLTAFVGSFFSFDSASPSFIDVPQYGATGGGVGLGKRGSRTREGSYSPKSIPSTTSSSSPSSASSSSSFLAASADSFNARAILEMDTIQELTNRITIIALPEVGRIITIHRAPMPFIDEILGDWWGVGGDATNNSNNNMMNSNSNNSGVDAGGHARFATIDYVTSLLTHEAVRSYHQAVSQAIIQFDSLEARLFVPQKQRAVLAREIYHVKRRASVFSRSLQLIHESYASMCGALGVSHYDSTFREVSQELIHVRSLSDELGENATTVLSLLFQLSSYQLNGLMRVLTLFSAFFIPLTFIASVCGMNFDSIGIGYLGTVTSESDGGTTEKPLYRLMIKDENGWNQWLVGSSMVGSALGLMVTFRLRGLL